MYWNDLNSRLKAEYGCKVYKLALSSGCSCPNRDGTLDTRGCIFCDGAGAFAEAGAIPDQLAAARLRVAAKAGTDAKYIAYFQSFTNTYGDADRLRALYQAAMAPEDVVILSIATRPDCLGPDILGLLEELNRIKPVWVELGLQTMLIVGGTTKLLPLTGVTLPLVSYGGSSLVSMCFSMGLLLGISSMNAEDEARDIDRLALSET